MIPVPMALPNLKEYLVGEVKTFLKYLLVGLAFLGIAFLIGGKLW